MCFTAYYKISYLRSSNLRLLAGKKFLAKYYHSESVYGFKRKVRSAYQVADEVVQNRIKESNFYRLVTAYRQHGHKYADINPVSLHTSQRFPFELDIKRYGLDHNQKIEAATGCLSCRDGEIEVEKAVEFLNKVYCGYIGAEFMYLKDEQEQEWFATELEKLPNIEFTDTAKIILAKLLLRSQAFDNFLAKKFSSVKRYGAEGAESMMAFFDVVLHMAARENIEEIVLAMPHRGRLNLLTGLLNFPPVQIFYKLKGNSIAPSKYQTIGDVLSHLISSTDIKYGDKSVHLSLLYNPSHLEAVNPVSMGKTRAKHMTNAYGDYDDKNQWADKIICVQVHGDGALMGQGVNQECLALSGAPHFEIGGTIHLVVNNQLGFTTPPEHGRSSRYCTDIAKMISAPVIHVNGNYPEEVLKVATLAYEYQRKFRKDIYIDMNCFRKWGHNEMDDPTFTNPALYKIINSSRSVPDLYAEKLIREGVLREDQCKEIYEEHFEWLSDGLKAADDYEPEDIYFKKYWQGYQQPEQAITTWDTGIDTSLMSFVIEKSVKVPENFTVHPTILRGHIKNRLLKVSEGVNIDWSTAEAIAIGSLLFEGFNVRISGQDVGRGTFSQRHAMLVDQQTNEIYIPLNNMHADQTGQLEIANSILSEEAVLGYEYGMSIESPKNLIIWEAQFGDFFNGAQIMFDTFISSGEAKWLWQSGLTVLLPHGYDGAGPEHSSSRIERFLQLTDSKENSIDGDDVNMQVCQPSTPAQYFHLLRQQMIRNFRKPLIIITPKTLLRSPMCVSSFQDMNKGTHFKPVLTDATCDPSKIRKVLITSGKHYYSLLEARDSVEFQNVAIVRLESFCPFPTVELLQEIERYKNCTDFLWCQEEPRNMGAWLFVKRRFENLIGKPIKYCGRPVLPAPAVGIGDIHQQQAADIVLNPFLA